MGAFKITLVIFCILDRNVKNGAVPGIPGRDYPVHQEHTHHNLRNVADRFPCPRSEKTHIYLADRASRCQVMKIITVTIIEGGQFILLVAHFVV